MLLIASSCLLAGASACIFSALMFPADPLMLWRVIPIAVLHLWPVIFAMALMRRWSRARLFGALLLWCAATWVVLSSSGYCGGSYGSLLLQIMASEWTVTGAVVVVVFLGNATRHRPVVLMPAALLAWSSSPVYGDGFIGEGGRLC